MKFIKRITVPANNPVCTSPESYGVYELTDDEVARNKAPGKFIAAYRWGALGNKDDDYVPKKSDIDEFIVLMMHYADILPAKYVFGNTVRECELELKATTLEQQLTCLRNMLLNVNRFKDEMEELTKAYSSRTITLEDPFVYGEDVEHGKED